MNSISTLAVATLSAFGVACGGSSEPPSASTRAPLVDVNSVQAALAKPTGAVSIDTMKPINEQLQELQGVMPAFNAILAMGADTAKACATTSESGSHFDLSCLTRSEVSGTLTLVGATDMSAGTVTAKLDSACVEDYCTTATAVVDQTGPADASTVTLAVTATVTDYLGTNTFSFGAQGTMGEPQLTGKVVYFTPSGDSVVVDGGKGIVGVFTYIVTGNNGPFECTFIGSTGTCNGGSVFAF